MFTFYLKNFYLNFCFQNDDQLLIKFHEISTVFFLHVHLQRKSTFFYMPPKIFSVCGGSKNLFDTPKKFLVCVGHLKTFLIPPNFECVWGGLKTEAGKFHEILTVFFLLHEHLQRKSTFFIPHKNF